ncbi:DsbA family protein [Pseudomonas chlororaphis]|uniref:DsbA family protein n=1 Tax=Pseudomonas chlororaphis TaxID=587753 RepID=UPI003D138050
MPQTLHIDFVSDVSCTWCAVGLRNLEQALGDLGDAVEAEFHFRPFELNPQMLAGGQNLIKHLQEMRASALASLAAFALIGLILGIGGTVSAVVYGAVTSWGLTFAGAAILLQTSLVDTAGDGADVAQSMSLTF